MKQWGIMIIIDENEIIKQMETWLHQGAWQWSLTHWEQWRLRQWSLTPWIHTVDALLVWAAAALIHCAHGVRLHNKSANENTYQKLLLKQKMELLLSLIVVKTKECKWDHKTTIIYRTHEHHPQQQMMITITTRTKNTMIKQMKTLLIKQKTIKNQTRTQNQKLPNPRPSTQPSTLNFQPWTIYSIWNDLACGTFSVSAVTDSTKLCLKRHEPVELRSSDDERPNRVSGRHVHSIALHLRGTSNIPGDER